MTFLTFEFHNIAKASSLPNGIFIGDDSGNSVDGLGNYFIEKNDIKPGDKFSKNLTISNYPVSDEENIAYNVSMYMKPIEKQGIADLYNDVTLTLTSGGHTLYEGNIIGESSNGTNYQTTPLFLLHVAPGEAKSLVASFSVSDSLRTDYWEEEVSWADFGWQFIATDDVVPVPSSSSAVPNQSSSPGQSSSETPTSSTPLRLPQTGEEWAVTLLGLAVGIIVITFVLVIVKKMRDNKEE